MAVTEDEADLEAETEVSGGHHYKCWLRVQGMTCASCVATIEARVRQLPGVRSVLVALMAGKAEVLYDPGIVQPVKIAAEVAKLGFPSSVLEEGTSGENITQMKARQHEKYRLSRFYGKRFAISSILRLQISNKKPFVTNSLLLR